MEQRNKMKTYHAPQGTLDLLIKKITPLANEGKYTYSDPRKIEIWKFDGYSNGTAVYQGGSSKIAEYIGPVARLTITTNQKIGCCSPVINTEQIEVILIDDILYQVELMRGNVNSILVYSNFKLPKDKSHLIEAMHKLEADLKKVREEIEKQD